MALKANYEFLFFGKDENTFLENYAYDLFQDYGEKSGQVFINLEIQNNPVDAEEIGAVIYETMQKVFFEDVSRDPYERFEIALKAVNNVLNEFKGQKKSGYIGNMNVIIAAIVGTNLFLSQTGDSEAYLIRKRYVSVISEGLSDEDSSSNEIFTSIANGQIESGDFVLLASTRLLRYISKTDLAQAVSKKGIEETLNDIKDIVSTEILGRIGLCGMLFSEAAPEEIESIEQSVDTATQTVLESSESKTVIKKESYTGKFLTALKGLKPKRRAKNLAKESGGNEKRARIPGGGSRVSGFFKNFFSDGLGKNKILVLLILVIVVLVIGIWVANSSQAAKDEIAQLDQTLSNVQEQITEAETTYNYDKEKAKTILDKAYSDTMIVLNSGYYREKATLFLIKIDEVRDSLDNVKRIETPKVFADLTEKRSDMNALGFVELNDRIFFYEYNALYELVADQVQDSINIDDTEQVISATGFDDRGSVVFLTESGKLIEYRDGNVSFMDTDDGQFRKAVDIDDWSNRVYLLDATDSQIWRYTYRGTRNKFDSAEAYFTDEIDLSDARSIAIDSSVYVLKANGDIVKFYGGQKVDFYINNPPFIDLKDPSRIYTNEKLNQIFVLDSSDGRILVYNKDPNTDNITYSTQYLFEDSGELRDLYVDPDARRMFVLTENKILEVDL